MHKTISLALTLLPLAIIGCQDALIRRTDRQVYDLIHERQRAAIGMTSDVNVGPETGRLKATDRMYSFTPRPIDSAIPREFRTPRGPVTDERASADSVRGDPDDPEAIQDVQDSAAIAPDVPDVGPGGQDRAGRAVPADDSRRDGALPATSATDGLAAAASHAELEAGQLSVPPQLAEEVIGELMSPSIFPPEAAEQVVVFGLPDALAYADLHSRELQDSKEVLYLEALDLTLERHLWTPQFVASISTEYANYGQVRDFDHAMTAVSDFAVSQRLPYGGDVTARVVNTLMRDLGVHTTSGETGNVILEANLPLLRGAGRAAYESRYSAEREVIYAVRVFERFRREFLVRVAADYFDLQQLKAAIVNTHTAYQSRYRDWQKADFVNRMGQSRNIFEAPRAKSSFRQAEAQLVSAKERYATSLDQFKIFVGMSMETMLDVLAQDEDKAAEALDDLLPQVEMQTAEAVALRYRLDLLNAADAVDDAYRGVEVAKNRILPDLNFSGSATVDSDPLRLNSASWNTERTTWRGLIQMQMDDRKTERNAYRASIIGARRAEREYDQATDTVRADVRRAVRRIAQQEKLIRIQALNVEENEFRLSAARAQFDLGRTTNQDVVDAENDLLAARNDYAAAISQYRNAILEFRLATGTLRVTDEGQWQQPEAPWLRPPQTAP